MRGPAHAVASAALAQLAALFLGLFLLVSAAIVGLVTLRHGYHKGLQVAVLASITTVMGRLVLDGLWVPMLLLCLLTWIPIIVFCVLLDRTHEQGIAITGIGALVMGYAITVRLLTGDVDQFWSTQLTPLLEHIRGDRGLILSEAEVGIIAGQVHTWSVIAVFLFFAAGLLIARWWQAEIYNPKGFGEEFRRLFVPRPILYIALMLALGVEFLADHQFLGGFIGDAFVLIVLLFTFQGLALAHYRVHIASLSGGWLTGLYVFLLLLPQFAAPVLAAVGIADLSADFRRIKSKQNKGTQEVLERRAKKDEDG